MRVTGITSGEQGGITGKREASVSAQNKLMELLHAAGTRLKRAYMHTESV